MVVTVCVEIIPVFGHYQFGVSLKAVKILVRCFRGRLVII